MSKKKDRPSRGEGTGMQRETQEHGWGPSVDDTHTQDNPSARKSFEPEKHAPERGSGRKVSQEETGKDTDVESTGRRGEDHAKKRGQQGHHDTGPKGKSQRPSGSKDASAYTGVDPQDPSDDNR